jgi:hypothetical protein
MLTCAVCGREIIVRPGRPGRPNRFCPPPDGRERSTCARLADRFAQVADLVREVVAEVEAEGGDSVEARRQFQALKSFVWREANVATNRRHLVGMAGRKPYAKRRDGWWRATLPPEVP